MAKLNIQQTVNNIETNFLKKDISPLQIGDNVKVGVKIIEGEKERVQFYEGTIIAKKISLYVHSLLLNLISLNLIDLYS